MGFVAIVATTSEIDMADGTSTTTTGGRAIDLKALSGPDSAEYLIRVSDDFSTWEDLITVTLMDGQLEFEDSEINQAAHRFYQVVFLG